MSKIEMVDLKGQYLRIKEEVDRGIQEVIDGTTFINGPQTKRFAVEFADYLHVKHVVPCGNGTDALQIALMALDLEPGDEIIVPAFTYVATAEVIKLLGLRVVMAEVDPDTFMLTAEEIEKLVTPRTKVVIPVHLYGQSAPMESIMALSEKHGFYVVEDAAQSIGAVYTFADGRTAHVGTIGHLGCTSFFPSKNLGCYGDGGAVMSNDEQLGERAWRIANHGQAKKYHHSLVGCNSRLDSIQAAVLLAKLPYLDSYCKARAEVAQAYDRAFEDLEWLEVPKRCSNSTHVFHQYTIKVVAEEDRDLLKEHLQSLGIPSMVYYPIPLHQQEAFKDVRYPLGSFPISEQLCKCVLSLPIHTEMKTEVLEVIIAGVKSFKL